MLLHGADGVAVVIEACMAWLGVEGQLGHFDEGHEEFRRCTVDQVERMPMNQAGLELRVKAEPHSSNGALELNFGDVLFCIFMVHFFTDFSQTFPG